MNDFRVREAVPGDAPGYIRLMKAILRENPPVGTPYAADEFDPAPGAMAERIEDYPLTGNSLFLVALAGERGEQVIGSLTCRGGSLRSDRHVAELGVYVAREWRNQGVGAALIQRALAWGTEQPIITRIELEVLAGNDRALRLYERCGFVREGVRRRACQRGGIAEDMILMGWLKEES
ncbi:MAG: GNAT family N-acetyltransferase [Anaerolineae bacterium]|nr:GNAT family N-acetyltransferase [Anaerolineae bacterium]